MVPSTAWKGAPLQRLLYISLMTPRKTPSKAAYPRISAGDGVRLKLWTIARTNAIRAERGRRADEDVVHRHPVGGDRGLRRRAILNATLGVRVLGVGVLHVRVALCVPGLRRGVEAGIAVVAAEPPSREDRVTAPHLTPPWLPCAALAQA